MNQFRKLLPDVVAILLFAVISFAYFFPAVTEGRILAQHDAVAGIGAGHEMQEYQERTGERTRWTNSIFGGMPTYQLAPSYDSTDLLGASSRHIICSCLLMYGMYLSCCWDFIFCSGHLTSGCGWPLWVLCSGLSHPISSSSLLPVISGS